MKQKFENKYMVATRCFTYNHAPYIEEALNGFSIQETSFPVVYIIVDDASTDGAPEVLRNWCNRNLLTEERGEMWKKMPYGQLAEGVLIDKPQLSFIFLLLDENHYQTGKSKIRFDYIAKWLDNSKYYALCEGDDYWTDSLKLQKQVDYLENNPDVAMCYTRCIFYDQSTQTFGEEYGWQARDFYHLLESNLVHALTTVYRKNVYEEYIEKVNPFSRNWLLGDYPMWLFFAQHYKIHLIPECTSVYRVLEESASHSLNYDKQVRFEQSVLDVRKFFANMCPNSQELIVKAENKYHEMLFYEASRCHNLQGLIEYGLWKQQTNFETDKRNFNNIINTINDYNNTIQGQNYTIHKLQHKKKKYKKLFRIAVILDILFLILAIICLTNLLVVK